MHQKDNYKTFQGEERLVDVEAEVYIASIVGGELSVWGNNGEISKTCGSDVAECDNRVGRPVQR